MKNWTEELEKLSNEKLARLGNGLLNLWDWQVVWRARDARLEFEDKPWLIPLYQDNSRKIVVKKPAQMGYTEWALADSVSYPDQIKFNSLYIMPTGSGLNDLVQGRLDPSVQSSEYLVSRIGEINKVGLKQFANGMWYGRGANSPKQVISVDADGVWVDERDRIEDEMIPYLDKRLQNSKFKIERWFGTPTIPDWGIDKMYYEGKQFVWNVICDGCDTEQALNWGDNVDIKNKRVVCKSCKKHIVPYKLKGRYIAENPDGKFNSYYVCGLNSDRIDLPKLIDDMASGDEYRVTQAYNQGLGLPYEPKGATITVEELYACRGEHLAPCKVEGGTFMGIDVGRVMHVTILDKNKRMIFIGSGSWEDLRTWIKEYKVSICVIDALPEINSVAQLVSEFRGKVYACYYSNPKLDKGKYYKWSIGRVDVNRTASLDNMVSTIQQQELVLPKNLDNYKEFITHFKNMKRIVIVKDDKTGEKEAKWVRAGDDHYAHSYNYALLASKKLSTLAIY